MIEAIAQRVGAVGCLLLLIGWPAWGLYNSLRLRSECPDKWWLASPVAFACLVLLWWGLGIIVGGLASVLAVLSGPAEWAWLVTCVGSGCIVCWLLVRPSLDGRRTYGHRLLPICMAFVFLVGALALLVLVWVYG